MQIARFEEEDKEIQTMASTREQETRLEETLMISQVVAIQESSTETTAGQSNSVDVERERDYGSDDNMGEEDPKLCLQQRSRFDIYQNEHMLDRTIAHAKRKEGSCQTLDDMPTQEPQQQKPGKKSILISSSSKFNLRGASDYIIKSWASKIKQLSHPSTPEPAKGERSAVSEKVASTEAREIDNEASNALKCSSSSRYSWFSKIKKGLRSTDDAVEISGSCSLEQQLADTFVQTKNLNAISTPVSRHRSPPSLDSSHCHNETTESHIHPSIPDRYDNTIQPSTTQATRSKKSLSKSSSGHTFNTFGSVNSHRSCSDSYRNSSGFLLGQEKDKTWRGLFASVRQLSHSASTTGSSTSSISSSSFASVSSSENRIRERKNRRTKRKLRKAIPSLNPKNQNKERYMTEKSEPHRLSIVVVGDGAVGKSALTLRFLRNQFQDEYDPTIEDSYCRHIEVDGQEYTLDINDTAGQYEYRGHWDDKFLRSADGFICVYSVASMGSFRELVGFRDQIWCSKESSHIPMIMVGNKWDLADQGVREVPTDLGAHFSEISNALFVEASAKTGMNINEMFIALVREIVRQKKRNSRYSDIDAASCAPPVSITGYSKNATPPAPLNAGDRDVHAKRFRCCTIM
ncbi:hypothetical protein BGZ49_000040 [Haplosporangium sp. Z 27]|nr:hypothetical protein BGZ49_000040 [Haplosporangium sp. Z 27]